MVCFLLSGFMAMAGVSLFFGSWLEVLGVWVESVGVCYRNGTVFLIATWCLLEWIGIGWLAAVSYRGGVPYIFFF